MLTREWAAMAQNDEATIEEVGRLLDPLWAALTARDPVTETHCALHLAALHRFNDRPTTRSDRLTASRMRIR